MEFSSLVDLRNVKKISIKYITNNRSQRRQAIVGVIFCTKNK